MARKRPSKIRLGKNKTQGRKKGRKEVRK